MCSIVVYRGVAVVWSMGAVCGESFVAAWVPIEFVWPTATQGRLFPPGREHKPRKRKSVLSIYGINRDRTTSSVCSIVISRGVAVVWSMGVVCGESLVCVTAFVVWVLVPRIES